MKAEILIWKMIDHGDIQAVYSKEETDRKVLCDLNIFQKISLWQVI